MDVVVVLQARGNNVTITTRPAFAMSQTIIERKSVQFEQNSLLNLMRESRFHNRLV
jgi:hypothetical protein